MKIFILIYNEATVLNLNTDYVINKLKHIKNIEILRHPKYNMIFKWSHHQKMVIID